MDTIGLAVVEVKICSLDILLFGDPNFNKWIFDVSQKLQNITLHPAVTIDTHRHGSSIPHGHDILSIVFSSEVHQSKKGGEEE